MVCEKQDGLEAKLAVAKVEEILQGRAKEINDHGVVVALRSEPANEGDADTTGEGLVNL